MTPSTITTDRRRGFLGPLAVVVAIAGSLAACSGGDAMTSGDGLFARHGDLAVVEGVMILPEGATAPPTSRAEARIVDLDRTGTAGDFLIASTVSDVTGAPVPFRLQWRPGSLPEGHRFVVSGRLIGRGGTLYTTQDPVSLAAMPDRQTLTLMLVPTGAAVEEDDSSSYSLDGIPDPSETQAMPMTNQGDLESLYDDRLRGDSVSDYISSDAYNSRVIAPRN